MTTNEAVAAAMERHERREPSLRPGVSMCSGCYQPWPCDTAVLAAEVERLTARLAAMQAVIDAAERRRLAIIERQKTGSTQSDEWRLWSVRVTEAEREVNAALIALRDALAGGVS